MGEIVAGITATALQSARLGGSLAASMPTSCRLAVIMLQQPTQPLRAGDVGRRNRRISDGALRPTDSLPPNQHFILHALVGPLPLVVPQPAPGHSIQVF